MCEVPVCRSCAGHFHSGGKQRAALPATALANDLWVSYLPREVYTEAVTVVELICASPCVTGMFCFSLEYHRVTSVYDSTAFMPRHRQGARGNVTSYPLPWLDLLARLATMEGAAAPELPRCGQELADTAQVLLRTGGLEAEDTKRFLHAARVRRRVVLDLLRGAVARGRTAFTALDLAQAELRAQALPEDDVPPELVRLLDADRSIAQLRPQKAATPMEGRESEPAKAAQQIADIRPHAVLLEASGLDEGDVLAREAAAWRQLGAGLRSEQALEETGEIVVTAGSRLVDQFKPLYFGVAFAWCFKFLCWPTRLMQGWQDGALSADGRSPGG